MNVVINRDKELKLGLFDKRITFQIKQQVTKTSMGDKAEYVDVITTWAKITPISVNRLLQYGRLEVDAKYEVEMRYNRSLNITESQYRVKIKLNPLTDYEYFTISSAMDVDFLRKTQRFLINQDK